MTPEEKIACVESQLLAMEKDHAAALDCPYCYMRTQQGETLCCMTLGKAVRAILQRQVMQELAEKAQRIGEAIEHAEHAGRN